MSGKIEAIPHGLLTSPCDATNNTTERLIRLAYKIRAKTMRGFKNRDNVLAHPYLAQFIRGTERVCDFGKVV